MEFIITWVDGTYSEETLQELAVDSKWGNIISVNGLMRKIWDKIEDRIYFWELENSDLVEVDTLGGTDVNNQGGTISESQVSKIKYIVTFKKSIQSNTWARREQYYWVLRYWYWVVLGC